MPCHIRELIRDLTTYEDTGSIVGYYSRLLHCDSFLHSIYLDLGYDPEIGEFIKVPSVNTILSRLQTEYSSIELPLKRSNSEVSESSSDKCRNSKGLKVLSARVKSILINKRPSSYREVAEELITEMSAVSKSEEKNILRRVYDSLNVLIAAGVVIKQGNEYCWKNTTKSHLEGKRAELKSLANRFYSMKSLIYRNLQMQKPENTLDFPLLLVVTDENNNTLKIESSGSASTLRLKFQKEISVLKEWDLLPCVSPQVMPPELVSIL